MCIWGSEDCLGYSIAHSIAEFTGTGDMLVYRAYMIASNNVGKKLGEVDQKTPVGD